MLTGNYKSKSKSKGSFYQKSSAQGQAIPRGSERKIADEYGFKRFGSPTKAKPKGRENLKSISKNLRGTLCQIQISTQRI